MAAPNCLWGEGGRVRCVRARACTGREGGVVASMNLLRSLLLSGRMALVCAGRWCTKVPGLPHTRSHVRDRGAGPPVWPVALTSTRPVSWSSQ